MPFRVEAQVCLNPDTTQRQLAEELGIPRTTRKLRIKRVDSIDADPEIRDFFCSPTGLAFLHRLVLGAHFTLVMLSGGSPRKVAQFLQLTGLDRFVGSSYGTQRAVSVQMENAIIAFGKQEQTRLATGMKKKKIAACQDETFLPDVCLVAIEPSSNFILCEQYAADRKAATWTKVMKESLAGLPVEIIQSTSDEAAAIKSHVKNELKAHHSPDLFHGKLRLSKLLL